MLWNSLESRAISRRIVNTVCWRLMRRINLSDPAAVQGWKEIKGSRR